MANKINGKWKVPDYQVRASAKWVKNNLERIGIYVKKGEKERIRAAADAVGDSLNHYIVEAVERRMETEGAAVDFEDGGENNE